ncbi:MAG: TlpA family protein disulfide reductase [Pseudomonadota bacterium]|nr:MAG: TlpA family protein disulfide reductase [Pseudomonadota bacterium]
MKTSTLVVLMIVVVAAGAATGLFVYRYMQDSASATSASATDRRPDFSLPDLEGNKRAVAEWDGKVLMVNFWATWCPPCLRELPAFIQLQDDFGDQGLAIVGIAIDTPEAVRDFVDPMGINYPILLGEQQGIALSQAYGNRLGALPYTIIVDRNGNIVSRHRTEMTYEETAAMLKPLL